MNPVVIALAALGASAVVSVLSVAVTVVVTTWWERRLTGTYRSDGQPHRQPTLARRVLCTLTGGHRCKFGAHPSGSCIRCGWYPHADRGRRK